MSEWDYEAMGRVGLSGVTAKVAGPIAASISRRTGRPQGQILAIIGAAFLALAVINSLRTLDAVIAAGRGKIPRPAEPGE